MVRLWWSQSQEFMVMRHDVRDWIRDRSLTNQSAAADRGSPCSLASVSACPRSAPHRLALSPAKNQIWQRRLARCIPLRWAKQLGKNLSLWGSCKIFFSPLLLYLHKIHLELMWAPLISLAEQMLSPCRNLQPVSFWIPCWGSARTKRKRGRE